MTQKRMIIVSFLVSVAVFLLPTGDAMADPPVPGSSWVSHSISTTIAPLASAYGDGLFVALNWCGPGTCSNTTYPEVTSLDGVTWTPQTQTGIVASQSWYGLTFANGMFVAVGPTPNTTNNDQVIISSDGIHWTYEASPLGVWTSVTYGDGKFVAVGNASGNEPVVMTSPDGVTWTAQNTPDNSTQLNDVLYANGIFVAVAYAPGTSGYQVMTSPDGVTWSGHVTTQGCFLDNFVVAYGNGTWVIMGTGAVDPCTSSATFLTSTDNGATWQAESPGNSADWSNIVFTGSNFVAVATGGTPQVMTSPDGFTWTSQVAPSGYWWTLALGNGILVDLSIDGTASMTSTYTPSVPSPPTSVSASLQHNGVAVSWMTPWNDGQSAITGFTATASPGGATCTTVSTSCVITGLAAGSTYSITVTASNAAGTSDPSSPVLLSLPVPATLAATGSDLQTLPWVAVALVGLGFGTYGFSRRRKSRGEIDADELST